jgi:hypothetical protein
VAEAERASVQELLSKLELLDHRRTLSPQQVADRRRYGLAPPQLVVTLERPHGAPVVLQVGDAAPGSCRYVGTADGVVHVVDDSIAPLLDLDRESLRDRRVLAFESANVNGLWLGPLRLRRVQGHWWIEPLSTGHPARRASDEQVAQRLAQLQRLRAARYVAPPASPGELSSPRGTGRRIPQELDGVTLRVDDGHPHTLVVRGPCPPTSSRLSNQRLVVRDGAEAFCLSHESLTALLSPDGLEELRLLPVAFDDATRITLRAFASDEPHKVLRELVLERAEGRWRFVTPADARCLEVDEPMVRQWLERLAAVGSRQRRPIEPERGDRAPPAAAVLQIATRAGDHEELRLGASLAPAAASPSRARRWILHRTSGPGAVVVPTPTAAPGSSSASTPLPFPLETSVAVPSEVAALFEPDPLRFRERTALRFVRWDVTALETEARDGTHEALTKGDHDRWQLRLPVAMEADSETVDRVLTRLEQLRVERWEALSPLPAHGLTPPRRSIAVTLRGRGGAPATHHRIDLGDDERSAGCYGRVVRTTAAGPPTSPVFLLDRPSCVDLRAYLATRALAPLPVGELRGIRIDGALDGGDGPAGGAASRGASVELERHGATWVRRIGGGSTRPLDPRATDALLAALRDLRADEVVGYGQLALAPAPPAGGLRVTLVRGPSDTYTVVLFVGRGTPGSDPTVWATVVGKSAVYRMKRASLFRLLRWLEPPPRVDIRRRCSAQRTRGFRRP